MNKSTLIALIVFAALAALTIRTWRQKPERGMTRISFATVKPDAATRIVVEGPSPIELRKDGGDWKVGDKRANPPAVKQLLDAVGRIESSDEVTRNHARFAELEVDGDKATHVQTFAGTNKTADFYIGTSAADGSNVRVDDAVYLVKHVDKSIFAKDRTAWLDRKLFTEAPDAATKVDVHLSGQPGYTLVHNGQQWKLADPSALPAGYRFDANAARDLVSALVTAQAKDVLDGDPGLQTSGLNETADRLTFHAGGVSRTLTLGSKKGDGSVYARASTRDDVVTVPEYLAKSLRKSPAELRDLTLMAFDTKNAKRLEIVHGKARLLFDHAGNAWKIAESTEKPPKDFTLDDGAVMQRISSLASLRAVAEADTTAGAKTGLDKPADRVSVTLADGNVATLAFGKNTKWNDADAVYARGNADDRVYVVKPFARDNVLGGIQSFAEHENANPMAKLDPSALKSLPPEVRQSLMKQLAQKQQRDQLMKAIEAKEKAAAATK